jgi:hypothetical protein
MAAALTASAAAWVLAWAAGCVVRWDKADLADRAVKDFSRIRRIAM